MNCEVTNVVCLNSACERRMGQHSELSKLEKRNCIESGLRIDPKMRKEWLILTYPKIFGKPLDEEKVLKKFSQWKLSDKCREPSYGCIIDVELANEIRKLLDNKINVNLDMLRACLLKLLTNYGKDNLFSKFEYGSSWAATFAQRNCLPTSIYSIQNSTFSSVGPRSLKRYCYNTWYVFFCNNFITQLWCG